MTNVTTLLSIEDDPCTGQREECGNLVGPSPREAENRISSTRKDQFMSKAFAMSTLRIIEGLCGRAAA
jgi:hypothetical protein